MAKIIKVDFSKEGKDLYRMKKQLRKEKKESLSENQKIDYIIRKQAGVN